MRRSIVLGSIAAAMLATFGFGSAASASSITVLNPSFEEGPIFAGPGGFVAGTPANWTRTGNLTGYLRTATLGTPGAFRDDVDGEYSAYAQSTNTFGQTLSDTVEAGTYTLTVAVGDRPGLVLPDHDIELWGGTSLLASAFGPGNADLNSQGWSDLVAIGSVASGDAAIGEQLEIRLISATGSGYQINWDNVRLDFNAAGTPPAVPLPAGVWLLLAGLGGLVGLKRRARI